MIELNEISKVKALDILKSYVGDNPYILELKRTREKKSFLPITENQANYIINNHTFQVKEVNKFLDLTNFFRNSLMRQFNISIQIEKILIEKIVGEQEKVYHAQVKLLKNRDSELIWLPKAQLNEDLFRVIPEVNVEWGKYSSRLPMKHQEEAIIKLLQHDKFLLLDTPGLGKTASSIIAALESGVKKILVICPASLKLNWKKEISIYDDSENVSIIQREWIPNKWTIINYDILDKFNTIEKPKKGKKPKFKFQEYDEVAINNHIIDEKFDLIICDECFQYNTLVDTNIGKLPIGKIVEKCMDVEILSLNLNTNQLEYKKIDRWIKKENDIILRIKYQNELFIECTPNHKVYVKNKGYIKAEDIKVYDELYMLQQTTISETDMEERDVLLKGLCPNRKRKKGLGKREIKKTSFNNKLSRMSKRSVNQKLFKRGAKILWKILFSEMEDETNGNKGEGVFGRSIKKNKSKSKIKLFKKSGKSEKKFRTNEKRKSDVYTEKYRQNEKFFKGKDFPIERREWETDKPTSKNKKLFIRRLGDGVSYKNKRCDERFQIVTNIIQSRYWKSKIKNSYRNRWEFSQNKKMEIFGQKKNRSIKFVRVESIEILESGSNESNRKLFNGDKSVYNIEVRDNHNYFADNILVSNCHYLKASSSNRTKHVKKIIKSIKKRWFLTGTPITNKPVDLFSLLSMVEHPLSTNYNSFLYSYCNAKTMIIKGRKIIKADGASNLEELNRRIKPVSIRRRKEDVLDLPDKIISPVYIELDDDEKIDYDSSVERYIQMREEQGKNVSYAKKLVELSVLRRWVAEKKLKHTKELINNSLEGDKKVIVFTDYTSVVNTLKEEYKDICVVINGETSQKDRQKAVEDFQNNPNVRLFIGNTVAAGVGLTLTAAEVVIVNDLNYTPANIDQSLDRAYRIGQTKDVICYFPLFDDTVDTIVYEVLDKKRSIINMAIDGVIDNKGVVEEIIEKIDAKYNK